MSGVSGDKLQRRYPSPTSSGRLSSFFGAFLSKTMRGFFRQYDEAEIPLIMPPEYSIQDLDNGTEFRLQRTKIY
jgi:hypothetical protein